MADRNGTASAEGDGEHGATAVESLTFEQAQAELESIVEQLEDQHTGLDDALALWERGEALHAYCQGKLDAAAARIERLQVGAEEAAAVVAESGDDFAHGGAAGAAASTVPAPDTGPAPDAAIEPHGQTPVDQSSIF